ncbi:MAG: FAD-dependent oxidoreductase [Negativicutes bacterium]|nr:FAD-dependent oxidoreductase [Negativicutes bacterium]
MNWKQSYIVNSSTSLPVIAETDVLVAGGGAAGVAAAETAAKLGNKVILVEKYGFLGGAAVAGLSGTICGSFMTSENDNNPEKIVFGFAERFYNELTKRGGLTEPQRYGKTWLATHDPLVWKESAEGLLQDADAGILYHTNIVGVVKDDDQIKGVIVFSKSGFGVIRSKVTIDASGDAQVVYSSGFDFTLGNDGRIQNPTMIFRLGGVDVKKYLGYWGKDTISPPKVVEMLHTENHKDEYMFPRIKIWVFDTPRPNELLVNATRLVDRTGKEYNPLDPFSSTEAEILGRKQVRAYAKFFKENIPGCEKSFVNDTGVEIGVRQTRSIVGIEKLTNEDVVNKRKRSDGIVKSSWPIELHAGQKPTTGWLVNDYYEIPYGALVPIQGENIIVAGRCLAAEHEALASSRVTAQCFEYGHAAGIAADLRLKSGTAFRNIKGEEVRYLLNKNGARLD